MVNFCKNNPEAVLAILTLSGALISFLVIAIIGLLKGWWKHTERGEKDVWSAINDIRDKQAVLRERLPIEYVRISTLDDIKETWRDLAIELKEFMKSCRAGECFAGQMMKKRGPV